jgi:hypothetical protein
VPRNVVATGRCITDSLNGEIRTPVPADRDIREPGGSAGYVIHAIYQYDPGAGVATSRTSSPPVADRCWISGSTCGARTARERRSDAHRSVNPAIAATAGYVAASVRSPPDPTSNLWFDRYMATSRDFGLTWTANVRLSDSSSAVSRNWPDHVDSDAESEIVPCYHGDYDQIAITGSTVHAAWSDDRRVGPGCPSDPNNPNDPSTIRAQIRTSTTMNMASTSTATA